MFYWNIFYFYRGSTDYNKNSQKVKTKPYSPPDEKSPNQVIPPRYGDTWKQTYDGAQRAKNKQKEVWDRNDGGALFSDQEELNVGTPHGGKGFPGKVTKKLIMQGDSATISSKDRLH